MVYRITSSRRVYRDVDADVAEVKAAIEETKGEEKPPAKTPSASLEAPLG